MEPEEAAEQWARGFEKAAGMAVSTADKVSETIALAIFHEAVPNVPVDKGTLVNSGEIVRDGDGQYRVGFYAPYAIVVEERSDVHHANGKAHYLRDAVAEVELDVLEIGEAGVRAALEAAGLL